MVSAGNQFKNERETQGQDTYIKTMCQMCDKTRNISDV